MLNLSNIAFKYHGNYGGPNYTGGKIGGSDFSVPPIDSLDALFRTHDYFYFHGLEKSGDILLVKQLGDLIKTLPSGKLRQKAIAAKRAFFMKEKFSKDHPVQISYTGAGDLDSIYNLPKTGPHKLVPMLKSLKVLPENLSLHASKFFTPIMGFGEYTINKVPPAPRLVGIELHPGPKKKSVAVKAKKAIKKAIKKVAKVESQALVPRPIKGQGGYFSDILSGLGSLGGKALGSAFGPVGSMVGGVSGGWLGNKLAKIAGFGKYKIKSNALLANQNFMFNEGNSSPTFEYTKDGSVIICHREFLGVLNASASTTASNVTAFGGRFFNVNPTNSATFPWLHAIALMFQEWEPMGIIFETKKLIGTTASAGGTIVNNIGEVFAASIYDIQAGYAEVGNSGGLNLPFQNQSDMENTEFTQDHAAYESFYHPLECDPSQRITKNLTCYAADIAVGTQIIGFPNNTNTLCLTQFASAYAPQVSEALQEIFIIYKIKLMKPLIKFAPVSKNLFFRADALASVVNATPLGLATSTTLPLVNRLAVGSSLFPSSITTSTGSLLNFLSSSFSIGEKFEVSYYVGGTAAAIAAPTISYGTGLVALAVYDNGTTAQHSIPADAVSSARFQMVFAFSVTEAISTTSTTFIKFGNGGTLPTNPTQMECYIKPLRRIVNTVPAY